MTTPRDPLAAALRDALASERTSPSAHADDDALIARAVARATAALAVAPATAAVISTSRSAGAAEQATTSSAAKPAAAKPVAAAKPAASSAAKSSAAKISATESARLVALTRPRTRLLRVMLPLAAAFAASIAVAAVYVSSQSAQPLPSPATFTPLEPAPEQHTSTSSITPAEIKAEPSVSVHDLPSAKTLAAVTSDTVAFSPPPHADSPVTAAELFRDANAQRRANELGKAVDLYKTLQKRFPGAPETQASRVSLGRLLLDRQGDAAGALVQFDAYLAGAQADGGTLAEEARLGRALSFEKLGRRADEARAWEELLARHPQSLHGSRAHERLNVIASER
ncbi:MAG: hypothetical protein KF850_15170 [Labilithrix sp.]|nr:hypothetical protein [Labilithrix sp.]